MTEKLFTGTFNKNQKKKKKKKIFEDSGGESKLVLFGILQQIAMCRVN